VEIDSGQITKVIGGAFFVAWGLYFIAAAVFSDLRPKARWRNDKVPPLDDVSPDSVRRLQDRNRTPGPVCFVMGLVMTIWGTTFMLWPRLEDAELTGVAVIVLFCTNALAISAGFVHALISNGRRNAEPPTPNVISSSTETDT